MDVKKYLSVIVPARNAEQTITSSILSLLIALPRNSEILVFLDDCSDKTKQKIARFRSKRIRVIESDVNVGVASALNSLIEESNSEYIARQDADDISLPWRFLGLQKRLRKCDLLFATQINFTNWRLFFVRQPLPIAFNNEELRQVLIRANTLTHSSLIAKSNTLKELQGYHKVPAEDYNLWLRALISGYRLRKYALPSVLFRKHPGQITKSEAWMSANSVSTENLALVADLANSRKFAKEKLGFIQELYISFLDRKLGRKSSKTTAHGLALSVLDTVFWRIGTLVITLLVAIICSVEDYALYAAAALATTFFQGMVEGTLRLQQVSQMLVSRSRERLRKYSFVTLVASLVMLPIALLGVTLAVTANVEKYFLVLPFVLALPFMWASTLSQIKLQAYGHWRLLTKLRLSSVLITVTLLIPTIVTTKSIAVGAFSLALSEFAFLVLFKYKNRGIEWPTQELPYAHLETQRRYFDAMETQINLWIRTQLDRVLIVSFASTKLVAFYLLVLTVAKTPTETLSAGLNRFIKSEDQPILSGSTETKTRNRILIVQLLTILFVLLVSVLGIALGAGLPSHLVDVVNYIPLYASAAVPAALSATLFEIKFRDKPTFNYFHLYGMTILFSILISSALQFYGYFMAGVFLCTKEIVMCIYWYKIVNYKDNQKILTQTIVLTLAAFLIASINLVV